MLSRFLGEIRAGDYDLVFDFHGILKSGVIAILSGSTRRVGFEKEFVKEFNHLFTNRKVRPTDARLSRVERNLELVKPFVAPENITERPALGVADEHRAKARAFISAKFGESRPLVAVHPGTSRELKKWFAQHFATLCDTLVESLGAGVMITWGPGERAEAERIRSLARSRPEVAIETGGVLELAALLEMCDLMITVDSGPMHIGSAVGTPVVAIFGPTDVGVNAPSWPPNEVVTADIDCRPCEEDCDFARCMDAVSPEEVFEAAKRLLAQSDTNPPRRLRGLEERR
jgi:ADP-heptose:LPS heptosyltransferase